MGCRTVLVSAALFLLAGCTASHERSTPSLGPSQVAPATADGLRHVSGYAMEFCAPAVPVSGCPHGAIPASLRTPLHLPALGANTACPVTQPNPAIWDPRAPGLGPGPVAPVGLGTAALLRYRRFGRSRWGGQKVLWVAAPSYAGPALIRGGRLDGPGSVGFNMNGDGPPLAELQLPPGDGSAVGVDHGYREWPSYTRVREPGCYAYQVDGVGFSYAIVFRASPMR
jgi:hypothetical protein